MYEWRKCTSDVNVRASVNIFIFLRICTGFPVPAWMLIADMVSCPNQSPLMSGHCEAVCFVLSKAVTTHVGLRSGCTFCLVHTSHHWCRVILRLYVLSCPHQSPLMSCHSKAVRFVLSTPVTTDIGSFWGCTFCLVQTSHYSYRVNLRLYVLSCPDQSLFISGQWLYVSLRLWSNAADETVAVKYRRCLFLLLLLLFPRA